MTGFIFASLEKMFVLPVRPGLLVPDPEGVQHLVLNSSCTETATPLKIQHLPATYHSYVGETSRAAACDGHIVGLGGPGDPPDASSSSGVEIGCTLVNVIPLT